MYRFLLKFKRLIKRYLKIQSESRQKLSTGALSKFYKFIMLILAACVITFLYPAESLFFPLDFSRQGEIALDDIISPFQITLAKSPDELTEEKDAAARAIPIIIEYDTEIVDSIVSRFDQFMNTADSLSVVFKHLKLDSQIVDWREDSLFNKAITKFSENYSFINPQDMNRLIITGNVNYCRSVVKDILINNIYFSGLLSSLEALPDKISSSVIIRIGKRDVFIVRDKLLDRSRAFLNLRSALKSAALTDSLDVDNCYEIGRHFIIPNLMVNLKEMNTRRQAAMMEISPDKETVMEGDVIVRVGDQIDERQENILTEIYRQKERLTREEGWYKHYIPGLARLLLILTAFSLLYLYLYYYRNQLYRSNQKILALLLIYGLELMFIYFVDTRLNYSMYLYPVVIFSMLITILFDSEVGIFNTFIFALILGVLHRFNFSLVLITIMAGSVACFSVHRVRHRTGFFRTILHLVITYSIVIYLIESFKVSPTKETTDLIGYGLINAIISPLLTIGILPFFESMFGFTTDITLLELSDLNRPLLKRLALEAPGTYHHSIIVGNMAEAAAKTINANSLQARVGAYYHDIGKIEIPEYFVENQLGIKSKHDSLTPTMSAIILASHVKKGRIMGEEADLPDEVLNFIEEHHGTMTMSYFYNKAKELGDENPPIDEFKYPGPKPQKRETAIVMLADSVEAAGRTLVDPKPARITNLVQSIINDRFQSGELEECPLTLKDLAGIRESFVKIMIGVFHHRVEYPKKEAVE